MEKLVFTVPLFPGWYESWLDQQLDWQIEQDSEYFANESESNTGLPEQIRLDDSDVCNLYYCKAEFGEYREARNIEWLAALADVIRESTMPLTEGQDISEFSQEEKWQVALYALAESMTYESMSSPRYYNFESDRLFAYGNAKAFRAMLALARNEHNRDAWEDFIKARHSSYDGFYSHYPNTDSDWPEDIAGFDHNHLASLFLFALQQADAWTNANQVAEEVTESMLYEEDSAFYQHVQLGDAPMIEAQGVKLAEWLESDLCDYEESPEDSPALAWLAANPDSDVVKAATEHDSATLGAAWRAIDESPERIDSRCPATGELPL